MLCGVHVVQVCCIPILRGAVFQETAAFTIRNSVLLLVYCTGSAILQFLNPSQHAEHIIESQYFKTHIPFNTTGGKETSGETQT